MYVYVIPWIVARFGSLEEEHKYLARKRPRGPLRLMKSTRHLRCILACHQCHFAVWKKQSQLRYSAGVCTVSLKTDLQSRASEIHLLLLALEPEARHKARHGARHEADGVILATHVAAPKCYYICEIAFSNIVSAWLSSSGALIGSTHTTRDEVREELTGRSLSQISEHAIRFPDSASPCFRNVQYVSLCRLLLQQMRRCRFGRHSTLKVQRLIFSSASAPSTRATICTL